MQDVSFLVVDDCQLVRNLVRNTIENRLGSERVYTAVNGKEALELLNARKIDVIIADWQMPEMDGDELLRKVRKSDKLKAIPFIMMSSLGDKEHVLSAIQNGVSQYVMKPFTAEKLEDAIQKSWNSANRRGATRLSSLPEHKVRVQTSNRKLAGTVKNISHTGMLIELTYSRELHLFNNYSFELDVFDLNDEGNVLIEPIYGIPVRLMALESNTGNTKVCQMGIRFSSGMLHETVKSKLNYLLQSIGESGTELIQDN
ncbi:Protein-glutamate methylesterase/protein-glutamine glutaminase [Pseudoalteromonas holothuriae]|uniref:Protein-glutamate methylesterase/protein-glutamine glutaminase n=1 Tax=Pseudoalteromonas holothuriae TaxID=2963714 RepID=A0A9W4VZ52_9GAMM|nr:MULTISPECIES: response regulator [unclassified Pseudoalteromonas]CAH9063756.1 Protein-glutamate methylesterase/protein-glutamine glutaminase [Pseudoalteromonas sp. CIP111951]CAH9064857.1 Protein-glutamate methylesterase/protein-glutamine glutaminase [Pseudoalteromonas sp. CIP111854]